LKDAEHDFPKVRLWGTTGWLVTSFLFPLLYLHTRDSALNISRINQSLIVAAVFAALLAVLCFTIIPRTPPKKSSAHPLAFLEAYVFVEKIASVDARNSAETVFNLIALGVGPILAGFYNAQFDRFSAGGVQQYHQFWWAQAAIAMACLVGVLAGFGKVTPKHA